jgi:hypothetical protein
MGTFVVAKKISVNVIRKKFDNLVRKKITKYFKKKNFSLNQKDFLNDFLQKREEKKEQKNITTAINVVSENNRKRKEVAIHSKVNEIYYYYLRKKIKREFYNETLFSKYFFLFSLIMIFVLEKIFKIQIYKHKEKIKQTKNPLMNFFFKRKHILRPLLQREISIKEIFRIYLLHD